MFIATIAPSIVRRRHLFRPRSSNLVTAARSAKTKLDNKALLGFEVTGLGCGSLESRAEAWGSAKRIIVAKKTKKSGEPAPIGVDPFVNWGTFTG